MNNLTPEPNFDSSGYPTDDTLDTIKSWAYPFDGFWNFVKSAWNCRYGKIAENDRLVKLITGGWSGNEDIIAALQDNNFFWTLYWQASVRGGLEVFKKPTDVKSVNK